MSRALFDILDATVSEEWKVRLHRDGLSMHPIELDDEFFCDDVQEQREGALERYRRMKARLRV